MTFKQRSERGFTVVELLTVIAIMMVVTAIATPSFYYWLPKYRLSAGARQIAADLQLARMKAISQNTSYWLRFINETQYQFEKVAGTAESGPFTLPDQVEVTNATPFNTSVFQSRGTASGAQTITLTNEPAETADNENSRLVCIKTVGRVHIERLNDGC
jgi:type II secretion system protein H